MRGNGFNIGGNGLIPYTREWKGPIQRLTILGRNANCHYLALCVHQMEGGGSATVHFVTLVLSVHTTGYCSMTSHSKK
jgi:hypothetical protein